MSDLSKILRQTAQLLTQQANMIDHMQAAEGRQAELEHIVERLTADVRRLQDWAANEVTQTVHRLAERKEP